VVAHDPGRADRRNAMAGVFCPGCETSRAIDLRMLDRHPLASVGTLAQAAVLVVSRIGTDA
jgi:hypothetical protein